MIVRDFAAARRRRQPDTDRATRRSPLQFGEFIIEFIILKPTGGPSPTGPQPHRVAQIHIGNPKWVNRGRIGIRGTLLRKRTRHTMRTDRTARQRTARYRYPSLPRSDRPTDTTRPTRPPQSTRSAHDASDTQQRCGLRMPFGKGLLLVTGPFRVPFVFSTPRSAPRTATCHTSRGRRRQRDDTPGTLNSRTGTRPVGSVVKSVAVFPTRFDRVIEAQCSERMYRYIL